MLLILEGKIKTDGDKWMWMSQASILIPSHVKLIKRLGIYPVLSTREDFPVVESPQVVTEQTNAGCVSVYLNDEKIGEQYLFDSITSNVIALRRMMPKLNRPVAEGATITITPITPGVLFFGGNLYVKVLIEYE